MPGYRWVGTHAYRDHANGRAIESGDELPADIADRIANSHPDSVEPIDDSEDDDSDGLPDPPFDPAGVTVGELEEALAEIPDDVTEAELDALYQAESRGKDRQTALEAIDDAR